MKKIILSASDGMVLTNGKVYCKEVHLGAFTDPDSYYEISQAEYDEIVPEQERDVWEENADMKSAQIKGE